MDPQPYNNGASLIRKFLRVPIHPFLFALAPVLTLLAHNVDQMAASEALWAVLVSLLLAAFSLLLLRLTLGSWWKAALGASPTLLFMLSYGAAYDLVKPLSIGGVILGRHRYLLPILSLALGAWLLHLYRRRKSLPTLTEYLNVVGLLVVGLSVGSMAFYHLRIGLASRARASTDGPSAIVPLEADPGQQPPDIYYIVLDTYPRGDVLAGYYEYDNSPFLDGLRARGFYVADQAHSNYIHTIQSVASSLNMDYLDRLEVNLDQAHAQSELTGLIKNSRVRRSLEAAGYASYSMTSGYSPTEVVDSDFYLVPNMSRIEELEARGAFNEFEILLSRRSIVKAALDLESRRRNLVGNFIRNRVEKSNAMRRDIVLAAYHNLAEVADAKGPKFVFVHVLSPHFPYLFDEEGNPMEGEIDLGGKVLPHRETWPLYRGQMEFITERTLEAIDVILTESESDPIIILQSDHGPDTYGGEEQPENEWLRRRSAILNVYLVPPDCQRQLYRSISPVNSFRVLFHCQFGAPLEPVPDELYTVDDASGEVERVPIDEAIKAGE